MNWNGTILPVTVLPFPFNWRIPASILRIWFNLVADMNRTNACTHEWMKIIVDWEWVRYDGTQLHDGDKTLHISGKQYTLNFIQFLFTIHILYSPVEPSFSFNYVQLNLIKKLLNDLWVVFSEWITKTCWFQSISSHRWLRSLMRWGKNVENRIRTYSTTHIQSVFIIKCVK